MKDEEKTKEQLLQDLAEIRQRIAESETSKADHERAAEMLEAERRMLFSLLDGLPAFVYLQSPDYSVRFANRYFREHFGEPEGKTCYQILWGAKEPCDPCPTFRVFDTKSPQEWEWTHSNTGRIYQMFAYPFTDMDGSPLVLELGIDITERKRAQRTLEEYSERLEEMVAERTKELREAQKQLVRQERLAVLGQLASGVGHELRNPLGAIKTAAYYLKMVANGFTARPSMLSNRETIRRALRRFSRPGRNASKPVLPQRTRSEKSQ